MSVTTHYNLQISKDSVTCRIGKINYKDHEKFVGVIQTCLEHDMPVPDKIQSYFESIIQPKEFLEPYIAAIALETRPFDYSLNPNGDGFSWSDQDDEMNALSKKFPDYLFSLYTDCPEYDEKAVYYYKNGKSQYEDAEITITYPECTLEKDCSEDILLQICCLMDVASQDSAEANNNAVKLFLEQNQITQFKLIKDIIDLFDIEMFQKISELTPFIDVRNKIEKLLWSLNQQ